MQPKQLIALAISYLGIYIVGFMVFALLPVYAIQLGMDAGTMGIAFALVWVAITISTLVSGWLSDRFQRRKLTIIVASLIGIPATFFIGQVSNSLLVILLTMIVWFAGGLGIGMITILTGLHVIADARGRAFGILASSLSLGAALGSFAAGAVAAHWGYVALFTVAALAWLITLIAALFIDDTITTHPPADQPQPASAPLGRNVWVLIIASILVSVTSSSVLLTRPLKMNGLGFDPNSISGATGVSELVVIPLPFLIGWLSDRIGRKQLLIAGYLVVGLGAILLASAVDLWQFWVSASLFTLGGSVAGVGSAFVTDMAPPEALSTALARYSASPSIGGIFGFGLTGIVLQSLGLTNTLIGSALLPALGVYMLWSMLRRSVRFAPA